MEKLIQDNLPALPDYLIYIVFAGMVFLFIGHIIEHETDSKWTGKLMQYFSYLSIVISIAGGSYLKLKTTSDPDSYVLYRTEKQVILKSYNSIMKSKMFDIETEEPGKVVIKHAGKKYELNTKNLKEY